jgi:hypothetical protein
MAEEQTFEDGADYLNHLKYRRNKCGEVALLWEILWKTFLDLNIVTHRVKCLAFLESEHFERICEFLSLTPALVRNAMLDARPPRPSRRGRKRGPRHPIVWAATFDSSTIGVSSNVQQQL